VFCLRNRGTGADVIGPVGDGSVVDELNDTLRKLESALDGMAVTTVEVGADAVSEARHVQTAFADDDTGMMLLTPQEVITQFKAKFTIL
jgi:hypothetical protein